MPPASSTEARVERVHAENESGGERYIDMRVDIVRKSTEEILLSAGGRWDRREKAYAAEPAPTRRALRIHDGQLVAARWFASWFAARRLGDFLRTDEGKPIFSVCLVGGRRAGKSDLAMRIAVAYAAEVPRAIVWIIAPVERAAEELDRVLEELLPRSWYLHVGMVYWLENGSEIHMKSSHDPEKLKEGRADLVVINEAQLHHRRTYTMVRPGIADRGGLVVIVANPPEHARGEWVEEHVEKARAGRMGSRVLVLDPLLNTELAAREALTSLADEFDERTLRRELGGEFGLPREGAVFYAFSYPFNVENAPEHHGITVPFLTQKLGYGSPTCHGMDFQKKPFQIATQLRFFEDPADPTGDPLVWIVDEHTIAEGDEDELVTLLEASGYSGADVVIPDRSGDWQNAERTKGRSSFDMLKKRGWIHLFNPDGNTDKNPDRMERMAVGNSLLRSASGKRKLRIDPRCAHTIRSVRQWETRNGVPNARSEFAHAADSWTYPCHRLFPRRAPSAHFEYELVERLRSDRRRDLDRL